MSYKNLEIWQETKELSIKIHEMIFKLTLSPHKTVSSIQHPKP